MINKTRRDIARIEHLAHASARAKGSRSRERDRDSTSRRARGRPVAASSSVASSRRRQDRSHAQDRRGRGRHARKRDTGLQEVRAASKRYKAHDETNQYKVGDRVEIQEHRPLSRDKRFIVTRLDQHARRGADAMIQIATILDVADNSGAKRVQCIKVLGGSRRRYARLGDIIVVSIKEALPGSQGEEGRDRQGRRRSHRAASTTAPTAATSSSTTNSAVLINAQNEPIGTRIFGPVARELRGKKFMKIISLAPEVL